MSLRLHSIYASVTNRFQELYRWTPLPLGDSNKININARWPISARTYAGPANRAGKSAKEQEGWPHPISSSSPQIHLKSTFQGFSTKLISPASLPALLDHLSVSESRIKRATHCMWAYRILSRPSTTGDPTNASSMQWTTGQNDGGESGAGDRLSRLLELGGYEDVVVVVYRWYGGVKLGSARWKMISGVAKEALHQGGLGAGKGIEESRKGKDKGKGK